MRLTDANPVPIGTAAAALVFLASTLGAQVDPSGSWRTWHTPHFRIHAKVHLSAMAVVTAREAERSYALLASELVAPAGRIDLVLADNVDVPNGFATPFPSKRVTIYLTPPTGTVSLSDYDRWLRLVITHELTHIFHWDRAEGFWGVMRTIFGRAPGLFPNSYRPSWVSEGLATYYESRFTTAGRVRGAFHRQLLTATADGGRWPQPGEATFVGVGWPSDFRPYAWGTQFFALQRELHGDSVAPRFVESMSRDLWPLTISGPLREAGGERVAEMWQRLRTRSREGSRTGEGSHRIIDRGLRGNPHPRISPNGSLLAYVQTHGKRVERLVVRDLATGEVTATRRTNGVPEIAWVGDALIVAQLEFASPVAIRQDLYRWRPGGVWERITRQARLGHPFAAPHDVVGAVDIGSQARTVVTVQTSEAVRLATPPASGWARLSTSPDGRWIAAARHHGGRWNIVLWPTDAPDRVRLVTDDRAVDEDPVWSTDGRSIVFTSERSGLPQIYRYRIADQALELLTNEPNGAREPALTPEGSLVYTALLADGFAVVQTSPREPALVPPADETPPVFGDAAAVAIDSSGYRPWPALLPHYWLPYIHTEHESGTFLGFFTEGSDPIGRTRYVAATAVAVDPFRVQARAGMEHLRWQAASVDVGASQLWSNFTALTTTGASVPIGERERRAEVGLNLRWRRWRSGVALRASAELEQTSFFDEAAGGTEIATSPTFGGVAFAARASYASRPPLAISPENGVAVDGLVRRRWALSDSGWSYEVRGGVTGYWALSLPGFAHWVLAGRAAVGRTGGPTPAFFRIGGESSDLFEIIPGYVASAGRRVFPLRGYPRGGAFSRAFVGVLELRVPLLLIGRAIGELPILVDRVSLAVFGETGGGWNAGESADLAAFRDVGAEAVLDIGFLYDIAIRVRLGGAVALRDGLGQNRGDLRVYLGFGSAF